MNKPFINYGAFVGATMYEAFVGRLWITIDKPKYMSWHSFPIRIGWETDLG